MKEPALPTTPTIINDAAAGAASRCYLSRMSGLYRRDRSTCAWCRYPLDDVLAMVVDYRERRDAEIEAIERRNRR